MVGSFAPLPDSRGGGASLGDGGGGGGECDEGDSLDQRVDAGGTLPGAATGEVTAGESGGERGRALGGGGMFHELQPLAPQERLRCLLCGLEADTKEALDEHEKTHLVPLEQSGKPPQQEDGDWQ